MFHSWGKVGTTFGYVRLKFYLCTHMAYIRKTVDIITSNELDYVLTQMKDKSEVARLLLKNRHSVENVVDDHINYIYTGFKSIFMQYNDHYQ